MKKVLFLFLALLLIAPIARAAELRGDACFQLECRVTDLWALTRERPEERRAGQEFTRKFVRL